MPEEKDPTFATESTAVSDAQLRGVFDYLDKEMTLEGSASALSGAAAAWILKEVVLGGSTSKLLDLQGQRLVSAGSMLLFVGALFFFVQRSRLANRYWHIARSAALPTFRLSRPLVNLMEGVDRIRWWWPYYVARGSVIVNV